MWQHHSELDALQIFHHHTETWLQRCINETTGHPPGYNMIFLCQKEKTPILEPIHHSFHLDIRRALLWKNWHYATTSWTGSEDAGIGWSKWYNEVSNTYKFKGHDAATPSPRRNCLSWSQILMRTQLLINIVRLVFTLKLACCHWNLLAWWNVNGDCPLASRNSH